MIPPSVIWAEDNSSDRELFGEIMADMPEAPLVRFVEDGQALLDALDDAPLPDLVVLDLKMPRKPGLETLEELRRQPRTASLPVTVFSSSRSPPEVARCVALGVLDFIQKPIAFDSLVTAVAQVLRIDPPRLVHADAKPEPSEEVQG